MFKIEITGIEDFLRFVAIIKNDTITPEDLAKLINETKELNDKSAELDKAVQDNQA